MLLLLAPQTHAALPFIIHPPPTPRSRAAAAANFCLSNYSVVSSSPFPKLTATSIFITNKKPFKPCSSNEPTRESSAYFDEEGVVQDMDGYLNYLSLEYDSVWDTKPSWCQPWTITLTGVLVIVGSWLILHSVIVSAGVLSLICAWWYIFLYSYPKAYLEMIAERRKRVTSGVEDTYGLGRFGRQTEGGDAGPSSN